jgi:hypothetical protein
MNLIKQYFLYLVRWQLSTPILAIVISLFPGTGGTQWIPSIVANLIGGLIFFWVDKLIFKEKKDKSNKN